MTNRAPDWLAQAGHDLKHARHALDDGDFDWACFAAHQAAEKAVKALFLSLGGEGWGHSITRLMRAATDIFLDAPVPIDLFVISSAELAEGRGVAGRLTREGVRLL